MRIRSPFRSSSSRVLTAAAAVLVMMLAGPAEHAHGALRPGALLMEMPALGLVALGQPGSFFDVTIAAGDSVTLDVDRVNLSDVFVEARTYVGVVSTIINGGFEAGDGADTPTGASTWVNYPGSALTLAPRAHSPAAFAVSVPVGTAPGQYVSSIVLENAVPDAGTGEIALNRVVRQVLAISIRVPGDLAPEFSLGRAVLGAEAGNTVVSVRTANNGNQHLWPEGTLTLRDSAGTVIATAPVTMGSFYAGTQTRITVALQGMLAPGDYRLALALTDRLTGARASIEEIPLNVAEPDLFAQGAPLFAPLSAVSPPLFTPILIGLILAGLLGLTALVVIAIASLVRSALRRSWGVESDSPVGDQSRWLTEGALQTIPVRSGSSARVH